MMMRIRYKVTGTSKPVLHCQSRPYRPFLEILLWRTQRQDSCELLSYGEEVDVEVKGHRESVCVWYKPAQLLHSVIRRLMEAH